MVKIGLGYLTLARPTTSLSGGESQRIKTVRHLGSSLTEMTYVVDEPTVGLHPSDVESMVELLEHLCSSGNSVLVVEHDPAVMARADEVIEIGPAPARPVADSCSKGHSTTCAAPTLRPDMPCVDEHCPSVHHGPRPGPSPSPTHDATICSISPCRSPEA